MRVNLFDFDLPRDRIAQKPVVPRDSARLLHVSDVLTDLNVRDLPSLLEPGDALVVNNTKVLPCRLNGKREGANVQVTLHKSLDAKTWFAFAKPARKLKVQDVIKFTDGLEARIVEKPKAGDITLIFNKSGQELINALETWGAMPLPPYIKQSKTSFEADRHNYQANFA